MRIARNLFTRACGEFWTVLEEGEWELVEFRFKEAQRLLSVLSAFDDRFGRMPFSEEVNDMRTAFFALAPKLYLPGEAGDGLPGD